MNITYLLGAGASAKWLPVLNEMPDYMMAFSDYINEIYTNETNLTLVNQSTLEQIRVQLKKEPRWLVEEFSKNLKQLAKESIEFGTVDTYIKYLQLKNSKTLHSKYVSTFSTFLTLFQLGVGKQFLTLNYGKDNKINKSIIEKSINRKKGFDDRYQKFILSLLKYDLNSFPENVKVLTWNYDFQFELAYSKLLEKNNPFELNNIQINSKISRFNPEHVKDRFSITKLNGTGRIYLNNGNGEFLNYDNQLKLEDNELDVYHLLLQAFNSEFNGHHNDLLFSWYNGNDLQEVNSNKFMLDIKKIISNTEILVVIGYSFPFFNRLVDKYLFDSMPNLYKLYVQDRTPNLIKEKIRLLVDEGKYKDLLNNNIEVNDDYNGMFVLPYEL